MSDELRELVIRLMIVCAAVSWLVILWRMDQSAAMPNFSFRNLIATRDGYPARVAVMEIGSWLAMSSVILIAVLRSNSEIATLCGIYVAAFVARSMHSAYLKAVNPEQKPKEPGK